MSGLPYKFEPGMSIIGSDGEFALVITVGVLEPELHVAVGTKRGFWVSSCCMADIDHAGTRGLLLEQYRRASGHAEAVVAMGRAGEWHVIPEPYADMDASTGDGESEGAAILDALTRLAAEREAKAEPASGLTIDPVKLADRLARIEARLASIETHLAEGRCSHDRRA